MEPVSHAGSFVKYEKMGEDSGVVGAAAGNGPSNAYIVTEKIHGANFCMIASWLDREAVVRFAKRTGEIGSADNAEDFYSCRSSGLLRLLAPCGESALRRLQREASDVEVQAVHIYGELYGGKYPHPNVPQSPGIEPVQVGIWYSPDLCFMAFDLVVETQQGRDYMAFDAASKICTDCGLMFAAPLLRGTLAECLDFHIEFESTIPARLGLPLLPSEADSDERNLAEGVVIRPQIEPAAWKLASRCGKVSLRGLFKRKIPQFCEKRYRNDEWKKGKVGGGGRAPTVGAAELAAIEISAHVTEQRLAAVMSKVGRVSPNDREACRGLLEDLKQDVRDALDEQDLATLRSSEKLQEDLDEWCRALIKQELLGARKKFS